MKQYERILLAHGAGGGMSQKLISGLFLRYLQSAELHKLDDAAEIDIGTGNAAFSTDTFVVKPVFFPGGNIGSLAVSGTVNDILMQGAVPRYLSLGFVIEEGFLFSELEKIVKSISETSAGAGVQIVTGDTKVTGRGEMDGIFINTSGIGSRINGVNVRGDNAREGDCVLVSGPVGDHGIAVMAERHGLKVSGDIRSDAAPLTPLVLPLLQEYPGMVHVLRDPTRGGVAATLNEIAESSGVEIMIDESSLPVRDEVRSVCEILGFDPLYLPCEGRCLIFADSAHCASILSFLRNLPGGEAAAIIGKAGKSEKTRVILKTISGGSRILDMPAGELLPRIC